MSLGHMHKKKHTHPLEKGKENIARRRSYLSDGLEGLCSSQQRHNA